MSNLWAPGTVMGETVLGRDMYTYQALGEQQQRSLDLSVRMVEAAQEERQLERLFGDSAAATPYNRTSYNQDAHDEAQFILMVLAGAMIVTAYHFISEWSSIRELEGWIIAIRFAVCMVVGSIVSCYTIFGALFLWLTWKYLTVAGIIFGIVWILWR